MGILDEVNQMKSQNMSEQQVADSLMEREIYSPQQIDDALSQAKIKDAVSSSDEMQPSIMEGESEPEMQPPKIPNIYNPKTQEVNEQEMYSPKQESGQQEYYDSGAYSNYPSEGFSSETTMEVSEQVFSKNIVKTNKQVERLNEFKTITKTKVENIDERLKKIETMLEKLQVAILNKVGSYGDNLASIKKEMSMMQNSFGKMVNKVADKPVKKKVVKK